MDEEQSAGEVMVLALIDQADRLGKSAKLTQQELGKQIGELVAMEAHIKAAVASIHAAVKNLEGERNQLKAMRPELEQSAAWAMREALREHRDDIKTEISAGMTAPLSHIQQAADHVRQNFKETKWLTITSYILLGTVLGLFAGYLPMRGSVKALEEHVMLIDHYLAAQQPPPAVATPAPASTPSHKGKK